MVKNILTRFMALCLGRSQEEFTTKDIVFFYVAFILIMSVLSYFDVGVRM
jgi:hypothetical protein